MYILILIIALFNGNEDISNKWVDFQSKFFKISNPENKFYKLSDDTIMEGSKSEIIMSYFITSNLKTNILTMDEDRKTIFAKIYNKEKSIYENLKNPFKISSIKNVNENEVIKSINFLNISEKKNYFFLITENSNKLKLYLLTYIENDDENKDVSVLEYKENIELENLEFTNQPIIFQKNKFSDNYNYKIYFILNNENSRSIYNFDDKYEKINKFDFKNFTSSEGDCGKIEENKPINYHHGSSFLDLDGDCESDLIINSYKNDKSYLEIYLLKDNKFCLVNEIEYVSKDYSLPSYKNLKNSGLADLAIINKKNNTLEILSNNYEPIISTETDKMKKNSLCRKNSLFKSPFINFKDNKFIAVKFSKDYELNDKKPFGLPDIPRFGDLFLDGSKDLIVNLYHKESSSFETHIYRHVTELNNYKYEKLDDKFAKSIEKIGFQTSLFDFADKGRLGWLINYYDSTDKKYKISSYFNYLNNNYFLKTLSFNNRKKFENFIFGANYQFLKNNNENKEILISNTQNIFTQSNYLEPIYCYFGLGEDNEYIKFFKIGLNLDDNQNDNNIKFFNTIIPNSQILLSLNNNKSKFWHLDIIISPTEASFFIVLITVVILLILGSIILFLHFKEKKEDLKDNSEILPYL